MIYCLECAPVLEFMKFAHLKEKCCMSLAPNPEAQARENIDRLLIAAGWHVCDMSDANIHAARGVAICEFPLDSGYGFADYLFYIDGKAAGIIEANTCTQLCEMWGCKVNSTEKIACQVKWQAQKRNVQFDPNNLTTLRSWQRGKSLHGRTMDASRFIPTSFPFSIAGRNGHQTASSKLLHS